MPFANEHACRIRDPGDFQEDSFRRLNQKADDKPIVLIVGRLKGETTTTLQAFRYPRDAWDADDARAHCKEHEGKEFAAATGEESMRDLAELEQRLREADLEALERFRQGGEAPLIYKAVGFLKAQPPPPQEMVFVASEESEDRLGDIIRSDGWELDNFRKNPVFMFLHDHSYGPIGLVPKVWVEDKKLLNLVRWDEGDDFARFIKGKYERGFMRAESVGFRPLEFEELQKGRIRFTRQELLEISAVPIPMHPGALKKAMAGTRFSIIMPSLLPVEKGPIGWGKAHPNGTPKADRDADWDAGREVAAADVDDLKIMCAWVDAENPDIKSSYKFPHHRAGGGHPVVFQACAASMVVLNGGRGGADIPDADREGVHRHIARHMMDDFEAEAPPLRSAELLGSEMKEMELKTGAVLNRSNRERLEQAKALIDEVLVTAQKPEEEKGSEGDTGAIGKAIRGFLE